MSLGRCRLCGKLYDTSKGSRSLCPACLTRLENMYTGVHDYLRTHSLKSLDVRVLAGELNMRPQDIQLLMDMGFLERDIQTYSNLHTERQELAKKFNSAIDRMKVLQKLSSYGGEIYRRK